MLFQFSSMVGGIDLVPDNPASLLQVLQVNVIGNRYMISRPLEELFLCKYVLLLGVFLFFHWRPTEQIWVDVLGQRLVGNVLHFRVQSLQLFQLVREYPLSNP
jgi:hypothetical protein